MKLHYFKTVAVIATTLFTVHFTSAQATFDVTASGMTFSPSSLTIEIGDSVHWTNASGTHNVNGTTGTFASNPESFGNALGTGWVFKHKFTIAGTYSYRCDQHFSGGMTGTITVVDPTASLPVISEISSSMSVYPIPATKELTVQIDLYDQLSDDARIIIYDVAGKEVLKQPILSEKTKLNTSNLNGTMFILSIVNDNTTIDSRKITFNN